MAPKYFSHSPYTYTLNNPVYFIDPDGMQVGGPGDEKNKVPVINGGTLDEVIVTGSSSKSGYSGFNFNIPTPDLKSAFFGNHVDGAYKYVLSPKNIKNYEKMQKANREGEWGLIKVSAVLLSPIILPELIAYGSMAGESKFSAYVIKTSVDIYTQTIFSNNIDDVNVVSAMAGAASEGTQLIQKTIETGKLPNNQDMTSALLKSTLVPAISNTASGLINSKPGREVTAEVVNAVITKVSEDDVDKRVQQYIKP